METLNYLPPTHSSFIWGRAAQAGRTTYLYVAGYLPGSERASTRPPLACIVIGYSKSLIKKSVKPLLVFKQLHFPQ